MTDTLRDKLIQKGWVTPFNVDTLVRLIEDHYADEPAVSDGGREPAAVTEPSDPELADAYWKAWHGHNGRTLFASHYAGLRAVLARWGHQPAPPADGEVAELVAWLRREFVRNQRIGNHTSALQSLRAAELLQRQALVPVAVSERLPEPNTKVLAHYFNALGHRRTICAIWVPAKSRSDEIGDDDFTKYDFTEYDKEDDMLYWPEGWYEVIENGDDFGWVQVDEGEVVYWQPLPKWPAHALPLPEVNND